MKKAYDFERTERWRNFKYSTLPVALHYATWFLTLFFTAIGFMNSTTEWDIDSTLRAFLCLAIIFGAVFFYAWYIEIRLINYRHNIIKRVHDNIQNCWSLNLTDKEKEELKSIITKDI